MLPRRIFRIQRFRRPRTVAYCLWRRVTAPAAGRRRILTRFIVVDSWRRFWRIRVLVAEASVAAACVRTRAGTAVRPEALQSQRRRRCSQVHFIVKVGLFTSTKTKEK